MLICRPRTSKTQPWYRDFTQVPFNAAFITMTYRTVPTRHCHTFETHIVCSKQGPQTAPSELFPNHKQLSFSDHRDTTVTEPSSNTIANKNVIRRFEV